MRSQGRVHAWFQCASGASGDMLLGALVDAGAPLDVVRRAVDAVGVPGIELTAADVRRGGLRALKVDVRVTDDAHSRPWAEVRELLRAAPLDAPVRDAALAVFARLAEAEARVHGTEVDDVHFHEVGGHDAIADVVGVCAALTHLGVTSAGAGEVALGSGTARSAHGRIPVPVPAVLELLTAVGAPVAAGTVDADGERELCTPTGAALLAEVVDTWGPLPPMRPTATGVGAGTAELPGSPNVLRVVLGEPTPAPTAAPTEAVVLSANVDDLDPRAWPSVLDRLVAAGADDAWLTPILMKKGRPAHTVSVLVPTARATALRAVLLAETSTIGLREAAVAKHALPRTEESVDVLGHPVRVKLAWDGATPVNSQAEHDDVAAAARAAGVPLVDALRLTAAALAELDRR